MKTPARQPKDSAAPISRRTMEHTSAIASVATAVRRRRRVRCVRTRTFPLVPTACLQVLLWVELLPCVSF